MMQVLLIPGVGLGPMAQTPGPHLHTMFRISLVGLRWLDWRNEVRPFSHPTD